MSPACSSHSFMHIHKSAADSGFRAQMQRVKSRRSSSLFSVWLLSALNQHHWMLRCLFEPYGKWEIFTYIIAGKKAMKVIDAMSPYSYKHVFIQQIIFLLSPPAHYFTLASSQPRIPNFPYFPTAKFDHPASLWRSLCVPLGCVGIKCRLEAR